MTGVLKVDAGATASRVRPFTRLPDAPLPLPRQGEIDELETRLNLALARIAELEARLSASELASSEAVAAAKISGVAEGRKLEDQRMTERLALIGSGVEAARHLLEDRLLALETAAPVLASEALARLIGDPADRVDILTRSIRQEISRLEGRAIIEIVLSGEDFEDVEAVEAALSPAPVDARVRIIPDLPSGSCRMSLALGQVDLSLDGQWGRLRAVLLDEVTP